MGDCYTNRSISNIADVDYTDGNPTDPNDEIVPGSISLRTERLVEEGSVIFGFKTLVADTGINITDGPDSSIIIGGDGSGDLQSEVADAGQFSLVTRPQTVTTVSGSGNILITPTDPDGLIDTNLDFGLSITDSVSPGIPLLESSAPGSVVVKRLVADPTISLTDNGTDVTIATTLESVPLIPTAIPLLNNNQVSSLVAGTGIDITDNAGNLTISSEFQPNNVTASGVLLATADPTTVDISLDVESRGGQASPIHPDTAPGLLALRTFESGPGVTVTQNPDTITFATDLQSNSLSVVNNVLEMDVRNTPGAVNLAIPNPATIGFREVRGIAAESSRISVLTDPDNFLLDVEIETDPASVGIPLTTPAGYVRGIVSDSILPSIDGSDIRIELDVTNANPGAGVNDIIEAIATGSVTLRGLVAGAGININNAGGNLIIDSQTGALASNTIDIQTAGGITQLEYDLNTIGGGGLPLIETLGVGIVRLRELIAGTGITLNQNLGVITINSDGAISTGGTGTPMVENGQVRSLDSTSINIASSLDNLTTLIEFGLAEGAPLGQLSLVDGPALNGIQNLVNLIQGQDIVLTSGGSTITIAGTPNTNVGGGVPLIEGSRGIKSVDSNTITVSTAPGDALQLEYDLDTIGNGNISLIQSAIQGQIRLRELVGAGNTTVTQDGLGNIVISSTPGSVVSTGGAGTTMVEAGEVRTLSSDTINVESSLDNLTTLINYNLIQSSPVQAGAQTLVQPQPTPGVQPIRAIAPGTDVTVATVGNNVVINSAPNTNVGGGVSVVEGSRGIKSLQSGSIAVSTSAGNPIDIELDIDTAVAPSGQTLISSVTQGSALFKQLVAGTNVSLATTPTGITINSVGGGGSPGINLGAGIPVYSAGTNPLEFRTLASPNIAISNTGTLVNFGYQASHSGIGETLLSSVVTGGFTTKGLVAGTNVSLATTPTGITINSVGGGGSPGLNRGVGSQVYVNATNPLEFRTLTSTSVNIGQTADNVTLALAGTSLGGTSLVGTPTLGNINLRGLVAGSGITLASNATTVTINSTGSAITMNNPAPAPIIVGVFPTGSTYLPIINPGTNTTFNLFGYYTDGSIKSVSGIVDPTGYRFIGVNQAIANDDRRIANLAGDSALLNLGFPVQVPAGAIVTNTVTYLNPAGNYFYESPASVSNLMINKGTGRIRAPRTSYYDLRFNMTVTANQVGGIDLSNPAFVIVRMHVDGNVADRIYEGLHPILVNDDFSISFAVCPRLLSTAVGYIITVAIASNPAVATNAINISNIQFAMREIM